MNSLFNHNQILHDFYILFQAKRLLEDELTRQKKQDLKEENEEMQLTKDILDRAKQAAEEGNTDNTLRALLDVDENTLRKAFFSICYLNSFSILFAYRQHRSFQCFILVSYSYLITDCVTSLRKLLKYAISLIASNAREIRELHEKLELVYQNSDQILVAQEKTAAGTMADKIIIGSYLPFRTNQDIRAFLNKDTDYHQRIIGLREVIFFFSFCYLNNFFVNLPFFKKTLLAILYYAITIFN